MQMSHEMTTSLGDARFFNDKIEKIVRGPQSRHDLAVIRRYFRGYLHCWKAVIYLVRKSKGPKYDKDAWIDWCKRWQTNHLAETEIEIMDQLRETRDYDTHTGTLIVTGEVAAGLFPLVFVDPIKPPQTKRELVTLTGKGLEVVGVLVDTHANFT